MTAHLSSVYTDYLACLNARNWNSLARFVQPNVVHNGRRVSFSENAIYAFEDARIREVWSVIDKEAIEAQLRLVE